MTEKLNAGMNRSPAMLALWLLVLISLLLNVFVLGQLLRIRRGASEALVSASAILADLQTQTLELTIPVDETIAIDTDLPVDETLTIPIQTEVPINTIVTVNVDGGVLGGIPLRIPISTVVPVDLETDVRINQTFEVHAPVELALEIPVRIDVAETSLYDTLGEAQEALDAAADQMNAPLLGR